MGFVEAFDRTMFHFKLKATDLAKESGVDAGLISKFKNGKNVRIDTLERILKALPPEARTYMLNLVDEELSREKISENMEENIEKNEETGS